MLTRHVSKNLILDTLRKSYPLSARKLFYSLKTQNCDLSYQAVHLFLKELVKDGVLTVTNKEYLINLSWVDELINYCYGIKAEYTEVDSVRSLIPKDSMSHITKYKRKLLKKYAYLEKYILPKISDADLNEYNMRELGEDKLNIQTVFNVIDKNKILLLGESGSGKTTLLKHMMFEYAKNKSLIPVFISLNNYYGEELQILIARRIGNDVSVAMVEQLLKEGNFLILFDGLNEAHGTVEMDNGKVDRKDLTLSQIGTIINKFGKNKYVVSCRCYSDPKIAIKTYMVNALDESSIETYLVSRGAATLYEEIKQFPRLTALCRNPLLLSTILHRYESGCLKKVSKAKIYKFFINHLLLNWDNRFNLVDECTTNEVLKILSRLGYIGIEKKITYEILRPEINHKDSLAKIMFASGLIKKVGNNYEFMYPCFQEYFACLELRYRINHNLMDKEGLKALIKKEKWQEVVLLYAYFADDIKFLADVLFDLYMETDDRFYMEFSEKCLRNHRKPPEELLDKVMKVLGKAN